MSRNRTTSLNADTSDWADIYSELQELYMSPFIWVNLPDTVNERFIEYSLMTNGQATFFNEPDVGFVCLRSASITKPNMYGEPVKVQVWGNNGFTKRLNVSESEEREGICIHDNRSRRIPTNRLIRYSKRILDKELTIDINVHQQKTPRIWYTDHDNESSVRRILDKVGGNTTDLILATNIKDYTQFDAVLKPSPFVADKVRIEKTQLWGEALEFMGISSTNTQKKARLTPDEAEDSNGHAHHKLMNRFNERKIAIKKINKFFDLNISIELNKDFLDSMETEETSEVDTMEEGDDSE